MDIHKNARLTPLSRGDLVRRVLIERQTPKAVATTTVSFRQQVMHLIEPKPVLFDRITRAVEGGAGLVLTLIALRELLWR